MHFDDRLPSTLFTGSKIESEHGKPVKIVLLDAISKNIITSLTLSSIKVQIVVLNGDFGVDDEEDWTEEEFNTNVVLQREGKRPLVTGELVVTLRGGVGYIGDVSFTDNSSWIRSGRFKLGARTVSSELRIREAKSEAFAVKDRRGECKSFFDSDLSFFSRITQKNWLIRLTNDGTITIRHLEQNSTNKLSPFDNLNIWNTLVGLLMLSPSPLLVLLRLIYKLNLQITIAIIIARLRRDFLFSVQKASPSELQ